MMQFYFSLPGEEQLDSTPIGTVISVRYDDSTWVWKFNATGFHPNDRETSIAEAEIPDNDEYIDCCGFEANDWLVAVDEYIPVGEHVRTCVETPSMIKAVCETYVVDINKMVLPYWYNNANLIDDFVEVNNTRTALLSSTR